MRARRARLLLTGCLAALCALPASAGASGRVVPLSFAGGSCDAVASATYRLPSAARFAYARSPLVGTWVGATKADRFARQAMARVTGVDLRGRTLIVTLAADPARCLGSQIAGEPVDAPWIAALDADVSWVVLGTRWARRQTRSLVGIELGEAFEAYMRARCRRTAAAHFVCVFGSYVGDAVAAGRGRLWVGRDDESPHYDFRVAILDEYCRYVNHRPLRRCLRREHLRA